MTAPRVGMFLLALPQAGRGGVMVGDVTSVVRSTGSELRVSSGWAYWGEDVTLPAPHPKTLSVKINAFGVGVP